MIPLPDTLDQVAPTFEFFSNIFYPFHASTIASIRPGDEQCCEGKSTFGRLMPSLAEFRKCR